MSAATVATSRHRGVALAVAGVATTLTLGLRVEGNSIGRQSSVRVFLVAAVALIAMAALSSIPHKARSLVLGAIAMLGVTIALTVGNAAPQGLIVLLIAIGSLVWLRLSERPAG